MEKLHQQIKLLSLNKVLLTLFIGFGFYASKSQNLITNGSFENYTNINCGTGSFSAVNNWLPISSSDFFNNTCNPISYGTPKNRFGFAYPINGNSYVGLGLINKSSELKEYIQQHISIPLIAGETYYTSFYVSLSDRVTYSIKNIGAYLSVTQPTVVGNTYFPATPQIENQNGFLTDTAGWAKIEGYFTAQGGEEYITIGNFNANTNTDTLAVSTINPFPSDPGTAYYYIDSVSLYDSLDYVTNIRKLKNKSSFNLYPNPSNSKLYLEYDLKHNEDAEMRIFDINGKLINAYQLQQATGKLEINNEFLTNGVYYYSILINGKVNTTNKIIVIK